MERSLRTQYVALLSFVSGIVLAFFSLFGAVGVIFIAEMRDTATKLTISGIVITLILMIVTLFCGYYGYSVFKKRRDFAFFNAIFLFAIGVLYAVSSLCLPFASFSNFQLEIPILVADVLLILLQAASFIMNGLFLFREK